MELFPYRTTKDSLGLDSLYHLTLSIAERVPRGESPALAFSLETLRADAEAYRTLCNSVFGRGNWEAYFPLKTASHLQICELVLEMGFGIEVISPTELGWAREFCAGKMILSGSLHDLNLVRRSIEHECDYITVDSIEQLQRISQIGRSANTVIPILVRAKLSPNRRLGVTEDELEAILLTYQDDPNLIFKGIHAHPGTQVSTRRAEQTLDVLNRFAEVFQSIRGNVPVINFGSGMPGRRFPQGELRSRLELCASVARQFGSFVVLEPGRPLVSDAAVLCTRVVEVREYDRVALIDAAAYPVHSYCRAAPYVFIEHANGEPASICKVTEPKGGAWRVGGVWPAEGDTLWLAELPNCRVGDRILFPQAGAYSLGFLDEFTLGKFTPHFCDESVSAPLSIEIKNQWGLYA